MTQQGSSSCLSISSFSNNWTYDVFLNFRGKDTRTGFTGNLYNALCQRGIHTFMDHVELRSGEEITPTLVKAIEESRIFIVVFSKNYASSRFCLDELVKILDCIKAKGRLVLPIFYGVDPSQVRHQTGNYGEALAKYEGVSYHEPEKVEKWRSALSKAANVSGYHYEHKEVDLLSYQPEEKEYEHEFIKKILVEVSKKINHIPLYVADYPVGLESRVLKVTLLLDVGSDDGVNMVGIYGIGGIGKSTIARAVYNFIADGFESLCFLSNIRERSVKQGLVELQEILFYELTGEKNVKFGDINRGFPLLKRRLNRKKVLIVLDDVDKLEQLQGLAGGVDWFGSGSRIIITTRDTHLLSVHGILRGYHMKELNHEEALELFNWNAFKRNIADPDFQVIAERAILCGHGLPLALEVIGSNLYGKTINEWSSALDKYEENFDEHVQEVLKVSYHSLEKDEKEIFLDIACFFNGETLQYVENILLHYRGFSSEYAISVLIAKCLVKICKYSNKVEIHHLIQDMGQTIVKQESPLEPGRRSRLWFYEDITDILEENTGTNNIQFIMMDVPNHEVHWSGNEFKKMTNLRVLIIRKVTFSQGPRYLPNSLRVLEWERYPSTSLPSEFHPKKLLMLNLCNSFFTWDETLKKFEQLKEINFGSSKSLKQIPDLSEVPNLTELHLDFCKNLIRIHDSVGFHDKLRVISAKSCVNLKKFPSFRMKSIETLNLECCSNLKYFPEVLGKMENLSYISLRETAIEELPGSIQIVTGLSCLDLSFCERLKMVPTSILMLPKLEKFYVGKGSKSVFMKKFGEEEQVSSNKEWICFQGCNFLDGFLPTFLACFPNITYLDLCGSNLRILPEFIQACMFLTDLKLDNCKQLQEFRGIPPNIKVVSARNCTSLMPPSLNLLLNQIRYSLNYDFLLPKASIPKWFDHCRKGAHLSFWFRSEFPDIALFVVGGPNKSVGSKFLECKVSINGFAEEVVWFCQYPELEEDHIFVYGICCPLINPCQHEIVYPGDEWNLATISLKFKIYWETNKKPLVVEQIGVYIHDRARIERDITFPDHNTKPLKKQLKWKLKFWD